MALKLDQLKVDESDLVKTVVQSWELLMRAQM